MEVKDSRKTWEAVARIKEVMEKKGEIQFFIDDEYTKCHFGVYYITKGQSIGTELRFINTAINKLKKHFGDSFKHWSFGKGVFVYIERNEEKVIEIDDKK